MDPLVLRRPLPLPLPISLALLGAQALLPLLPVRGSRARSSAPIADHEEEERPAAAPTDLPDVLTSTTKNARAYKLGLYGRGQTRTVDVEVERVRERGR